MIDRGNAPSLSGIGIHTDGLIYYLCRYGKNRINISESTASSISYKYRALRRIIYLGKLRRLSYKNYNDADVVHFTNIYLPQRHKKIPFISTIHDLDPLTDDFAHSRSYRIYYSNIVKKAIHRARFILTPTEYVRSQIIDRYPGSEQYVRAIGHGISSQFINTADSMADEQQFDIPTLLCVGTLTLKKNTKWLISTVVHGVRTGALPPLRLILAGRRGFGFSEIEQVIKESPEIVEWVESPDINHLVKLYKGSHVVVLPSLKEGFGLTLVEAMYCKKCIVASRIPTSVEVASDAALFFDLDDIESFYNAINSAFVDGDKSNRLKRIEQRVKLYMWENLIPEYINTYEQAVQSST